jgi:hypothetical protein
VVILLPLILILLILGALRGGTNVVLLLPMLLTLGAGAIFVAIAENDAKRRRPGRSLPVIPTNHLARKMRSALKPHRPTRPTSARGTAVPLSRRGPGPRFPGKRDSGTNPSPPPPSVPPAS